MSKKMSNPLDDLFETESATPPSTVASYSTVEQGDFPAPTDVKDAEDAVIDDKMDVVYDAAISAFNQQTQLTDIIEPRYAARNAEVAASYLNIALNAAQARAKVKIERKKANALTPFAGTGIGKAGTIVASREDIMRMLSVDAEVKEIK
jgi:hypothetical protein